MGVLSKLGWEGLRITCVVQSNGKVGIGDGDVKAWIGFCG